MITVSIDGRVTKDAQMRQAGSTPVCSFSVVSNKKVRGEDQATFIDVSIFGARGEKLCTHLTKGKYVIVSGELTTRQHDGKTYLQCEAHGISFAPGGQRREGEGASNGSGRPAPNDDYGNGDLGDIPF